MSKHLRVLLAAVACVAPLSIAVDHAGATKAHAVAAHVHPDELPGCC